MVDYGYGDAAPDSATDKYGYGNAEPDYGYGNGSPTANRENVDYGYGDAQPDTTDYGYGDAQPDTAGYGYGDAQPDGNRADDDQPKRSNRRRNSVTRYSIVCQDAVKNEFDAHANIIDQFRNGAMTAPTDPPPSQDIETSVPLNDFPGAKIPTGSSHSDDGRSFDGSLDSVDGPECDGKDKSKKKKKGWGFRLGRNSSN
ncbi:hypothetical protein IV203_028797 [Nitzschia inconspicua]|uniref:Uncharacterized protein n=1 Tax=Nitzschia inconspicua TaxID=303405 RepID=A0A9K3LPY8_9STRA|nr:hypothetical protein IV203_028797 [Nitzschia inconspicua]